MTDPKVLLRRHLILHPLLASLLPVIGILWAIDGPIRNAAEREESALTADMARTLAEATRGAARPPAELARRFPPGARARIVLQDAEGRVVLDTREQRPRDATAWAGPGAGDTLRVGPVRRVATPDQGAALSCEVRWGSGGRGGGQLALTRSLEPLDAALRWARLGAFSLWLLTVVGFALAVLPVGRRLSAEREELHRKLAAFPESAGEPFRAAGGYIDLDMSLWSAARRAREQLDRLEDEIREREAVLLGMLEGVIAVNRERVAMLVNPAAERMLGLAPAGGKGRRVAELVPSGPFLDLVERVLSDGRARETEFELEEGQRLIRAAGSAVRGADGTLHGAVLVMAEVTELRRLERMRRDFVANVSHELKTPLTAIQGYVETLLEGGEEDPSVRERFLRVVSNNVRRMHRIVEDLLELARVESAGPEIERAPVDLRALVLRTIHDSAVLAGRRGIVVDATIPGTLPPLLANEELLERALGNLIDNAVKYGPERSRVQVHVVPEEGAARIEVRDAGPGIAAAHLPRLFERFYRVDKGRSRELGGTGLGLAIVKHIAIAHGGEAGVTSRLGAGSTFYIRVPWGPGTGP